MAAAAVLGSEQAGLGGVVGVEPGGARDSGEVGFITVQMTKPAGLRCLPTELRLQERGASIPSAECPPHYATGRFCVWHFLHNFCRLSQMGALNCLKNWSSCSAHRVGLDSWSGWAKPGDLARGRKKDFRLLGRLSELSWEWPRLSGLPGQGR